MPTLTGRALHTPLFLSASAALCLPVWGAILISLATGWASVHHTTSTGGQRWQETRVGFKPMSSELALLRED